MWHRLYKPLDCCTIVLNFVGVILARCPVSLVKELIYAGS
jgi:hypothetical protein